MPFSRLLAKKNFMPLKAIYDNYAKAGIRTANYTSESPMIESMLQDFAAETLGENIKGFLKLGKKPAEKIVE